MSTQDIKRKRQLGLTVEGEKEGLRPTELIRYKKQHGQRLSSKINSTSEESFADRDRQNYEKAMEVNNSQREARLQAIELAKSNGVKANAGNDRTTALRIPEAKKDYSGLGTLPTYRGMNEAANGANVDQDKFKTEAATQNGWKGLNGTSIAKQIKGNGVTEAETLKHAEDVMSKYKFSDKAMSILDEYVAKDDESKRGGLWRFESLGSYSGALMNLGDKFKAETGVSDEEFTKIFESYSRLKHAEEREQQQQEYADMGNGERVAKSLVKAPKNVLGGYQALIGSLQNPSDPELGRDYNSEFFRYSNENTDIRKAQNDAIDKIEDPVVRTLAHYGYNAGVMGVESATAALTGEAGLGSFFAGGYSSGLKEAEDRGLSPEQSQAYALAVGSLEYFTERIPWEGLKNIWAGKAVSKDAVKGSIMPYIKALFKQKGSEALEEVINGVGDIIADGLISGDKSKLNNSIQYYVQEEGLSEEEATSKAIWDVIKETADAAITASISAGVSAGPALANQAYTVTKAGRNIADYENKTGNLTRNVENADYISENREDYVADEDYRQAQETRQAILAASEKAAKNERISGKEARALAESYSQTAENLRTARRVEGTKLIEEAKTRAEEEAVEDIKKATTPAEVETIKEEHINSEAVKAAVEEKKAEMIEAGEATEAEFTEAITPTKAAAMAEKGETIAPETLTQLPKKVQQAYETGSATQANKLTSDVTKTDINTIELTDESGKKSYSDIKSVSQNSKGEIVFELSNGESVKAAEASYTPKGKYLYNSPNGINSLDNPVLVQTAINIEQSSKHGVPVGSVTLALKDMYTMGAAGLDFEQAIKSRDFDVKTLGKENLRAAYEEGKKNSTATSRATYAKKGSGLIKESSADNDQAYKNQFVKRVKKNGKTVYEYDAAAQSEYESQLDESSKNFLELFSKKLGVDIAFFSENSSDRGFYEPSEGTIYLNLNHSHNMFNVALHEGIGEFMAASNEEAYNAIVDSVLNAYAATNSTKLAKDIRAYQAAYEGDTYGGTYRGAAQELFNDALSDMFSSEENMKKLYNWMLENEGEQQANKVKRTLADYFKSLAETIKEVITEGRFSKAEQRQLRISEKEANTYVDQILRAMDQAIANRNAGVVQQGESAARNAKKVKEKKEYIPSKEEIRNNILTFGEKGVIASANESFPFDEKGLITRNVFEYFKSIGGKAVNPLLGSVRLSHSGIKHAIHKTIYYNKVVGFRTVKDVIEKGLIVDFKENWDGRGYNTYIIAGLVDINGIPCIQGIVVKDKPSDPLMIYDLHEVVTIEIADIINADASKTKTDVSIDEINTNGAVKDASALIDKLIYYANFVNNTTSADVDNNAKKRPAPKSINVEKINDTVRHSFAGINSETADKEQLKIAQELHKKGMGDLTILETTGWFLGMDNQWKYEIPDNDIEIFKEGNREYIKNNPDFARYLELENKILFTDSDYTEEEYDELMRLDEVVTSDEYYKTKRYGKLSDFIQHDELFRSYPWMEKVDVMFVPMESDKEKGYADPEDLVIALNLKFQTDVGWNKDALKSTLLHEIQHIIQAQEGFAGGSTPEWWANIRDERIERDQLNIKGAKEHLQKFVEKAKKEGKPASTGEFVEQSVKRVADKDDSYNMEDHWAAVADWKANSSIYHYEHMISKLERHIDRLLSESDIELYYNTAGEIEARDTANRANLTREQRLEEFPKQNAKDVVYPKSNIMDRRYSIKVDTEGRSLSEGQQKYFKDSKVVDEEGRLRVVFHGTMANFTIFDLKEARDTEDIEAFFFSGDYEESGGYGNVGEYYLNITNPADYDTAYDIFFKYKGKEHAGRLAREELQSLGYDGVIAVDEDSPEYTEYLAFNSNQIKRVSNLNPTKNDDVRKSIKVDDQGRDIAPGMAKYLKDNDEVFFDDKGAVKNYYHGTRYAGFTQFSLSMMDDKQSIFLTDSKGTANTYAGNHDLFEPDKEWTYNQLETAISYMTGGDWEVDKDGDTITITEYGFGDEEDKETQFDSILASQTYFIDYFLNKIDLRSDENAAIYNVYVKSSNPYVVEADGNTWDEIFPSDYAKHYTDVNITETDGTYQVDYQDGNKFYNEIFNSKAELEAKVGEIYEDFENSTVYIENLYLDKNNNRIPTTTRQFAKIAKQQGYDSLVVNNVVDTGIFGNNEEKLTPSQVVVVFNPNQVKSVHNTNPAASEDIRYSKTVDSDGNRLSVQQKEMFKNSKAVDKKGNLLVLYHGSQSADRFNTFDMNARGIVNGRAFGDGFYFTPYQDVADFWGEKNLYKVYLNLINPYYANKSSRVPKDVKKLIKDRYTESLSSKRDVNGAYRAEVKNAYDALEVLWRYGKINDLKTLGYDGVIFDDKNVAKYSVQYVAFNPEQIKETTNLNPTRESKDIRYSISVGEDRIHTYKGIEIVQNPTNKEYQQMRADIIKERPWMDGPDTILLRHTYDEEGNEYYWDAYAGMHFEIEPIIAEHWKTRVNQQWEWWKDDDKDFWANRSFRRYSKAVFGEESQYSSQLEQTQFVSQILSTLNNQLKGTTVSMNYIDDTVKYILDKYDADLNPDDFKMELSQFIAYMTANEQVDYNQMMNYLLNVGDEVIQASRLKDPEEERIYSELKKELSSHKINLTEAERKELISKYGGSWNAVFGKLNAAGIKLNNAGQHMDGSTYAEIVDRFREIAGVQLDEEKTAVDQIATILDAMDALKPSAYQWEGATDMDKALDVATTIIDRYYSMATAIKEANIVKGTEKGAAAVERAKKNEIKKLRAKQEEYKAKVNEEFQQLVEDRKKVIEEQQKFYKRQAEIEKNFRGEKREFNKKANLSQKELEKTARLQAQVAYKGLKETEAKKKNKDNIVRTCMRLINWMNKPTDTRHVPTFLKPALTDMIKSINFMPASMRKGEDGTIAAIKWQESMRKLQQVLQGISNADAESLNDSDKYELSLVMEVDEIVNKMQTLLDKYGGTADISRMKAEDLKTLSDIMTSISKGISQMNENFMNRRFKHVSEAAVAAMNEMNSLKPISNTLGFAKSTLSDFLNLDMAEPITFFEELGSASESIMQEFFDGEKIGIEIIEEADNFFQKIANDLKLTTKDIRAWENDAKDYTFGGVPITLTSADLMSLYCSYNREKLDQEERPFEATHHIAAGGIKGFRHRIGLKEVNRNPQVAHVTEADVLRLLDNLTETQKQYADLVVGYMSNELAAHGNETSNKLNGYSKFLGKYYFPLKTDNNAIATTESNNTSDQAAFRRLIFPSFTKSQVDKADNALVIMNFFDVVTEHITGMSNYCAYAMPISDAMRWYNYAETERANTEVEDQYQRYTASVKGSMDKVRGDEARKYFKNFIRDVNLDNKASGSKASKLISQGLTGLAKAKAVGLNIRVIVQQPCAIVRAADVIEGKYLAAGWAKMSKNPKAATEYAQKESYLCYWKSKGFSDTRVSQSMKEIITGQESIRQDIVEKTGALAGLADDVTWAAMYYAAEEKIKATTDLQEGSEEFHAAVEELFSDIINHTQVIDSNLRKTGTMRSNDAIEKLANAFKKEPQKSYNMLHRAYWQVYQHPESVEAKKKWHRAVTIFAENAFLTAIAQSLVDAWRDDDDEEGYLMKMIKKMLPYESYEAIKDFVDKIMSGEVKSKDALNLIQGIYGGAGNILDNSNIASSIPYIADIDSLLKGYSVTRLDSTSILTQLKNTVTALGSQNKTPYSMIYSVAQLIGYATGIGADNALRDLRGIYNQFFADQTGYRIEKNAATAKQNAKKKETNRVSDVFDTNDMSSIKAEIQTAYEKGVEASKDQSESSGWTAARNMLKEQYQRMLAEKPEDKAAITNRFKMLLKYTKKSDGKGGYRTLTDKEIQNYIDNWSAAE